MRNLRIDERRRDRSECIRRQPCRQDKRCLHTSSVRFGDARTRRRAVRANAVVIAAQDERDHIGWPERGREDAP